MKHRPRIYYTERQKQQMWDYWQKGDSLQQIAQLFDRNHSSIQAIMAGVKPDASILVPDTPCQIPGH